MLVLAVLGCILTGDLLGFLQPVSGEDWSVFSQLTVGPHRGLTLLESSPAQPVLESVVQHGVPVQLHPGVPGGAQVNLHNGIKKCYIQDIIGRGY